jgi:5,10-methenyltetrahydromethanopterin hydrogenase
MTALSRFQYNSVHAGDAGELWRLDNLIHAEHVYHIEQLLEAAGIALSDDRDFVEDVDLLLNWIEKAKGVA